MNRFSRFLLALTGLLALVLALTVAHPTRARAQAEEGSCVAVKICNDRPFPFQKGFPKVTLNTPFNQAMPKPLLDVPGNSTQRLVIEHVSYNYFMSNSVGFIPGFPEPIVELSIFDPANIRPNLPPIDVVHEQLLGRNFRGIDKQAFIRGSDPVLFYVSPGQRLGINFGVNNSVGIQTPILNALITLDLTGHWVDL